MLRNKKLLVPIATIIIFCLALLFFSLNTEKKAENELADNTVDNSRNQNAAQELPKADLQTTDSISTAAPKADNARKKTPVEKPGSTTSYLSQPKETDNNAYNYNSDEPAEPGKKLELDEVSIGEIKKSVLYAEWLVTVATTIGDGLDDNKKKGIQDQQVLLLFIKQELQDAYLSDRLTWNEYAVELKNLVEWNQKFYQENLTDDEYEKLYNCKKGEETQEVIQSVMTPPEDSEVFILFPEIKSNNPDIVGEQDLYQAIDTYKVEELIKLEKERLKEERALEKELESGNMAENDFVEFANDIDKVFFEKAHYLLEPQEFQLIFGDEQITDEEKENG